LKGRQGLENNFTLCKGVEQREQAATSN
jgi:hypothetical protein